MSGAQAALLSSPMPATPPPSRDVGQGGQDPAQAEAAGAQFNDAMGEVDHGQHSPGSTDDFADEGEITLEVEEVGSSSVPAQMGGSLAAALAALSMPWGGVSAAGASSTAVSSGDELQAQDAAMDPLAALTAALAANDREPTTPVAPQGGETSLEEFIDVRILGRERHLGVGESAQQNVMPTEADVLPEEAIVVDEAALAAAPRQTDRRSVQGGETPETPSRSQKDLTPASADAASLAQSSVEVRPASTSDETSGEQGKGSVPGVQTLRQQDTGSGRSNLGGSDAETGDAPRDQDVALDTKTSTGTQFASHMPRSGDVTLSSAVGDLADATPASQVLDQLTAPASREVISSVRNDGDTRVIELQLKPENLGSVTVRVSLKDDVISLKLEAQRADTALEIGREMDKLANSLKQAGYIVDSITAQQMDPRSLGRIEAAVNSSASGNSTQGQPQGSAQGQSFQGSGTGSQQNGQGRPSGGAFESAWSTGNNDGQNNGLASERQTGLYV